MATADPQTVRAAMEGAVGPDNVGDATASLSVGGFHPSVVVSPKNLDHLSRAMAAASGQHMAVAPRGGGTQIHLGNVISRLDLVVDLSHLTHIVQHNPADLTATVEAGITLASLQKKLAQHGQFLALDPPLPDRATVGGTLAAGVSGPLKWRFGSPRDLVIGMKVVGPDGRITKSGGQVVKNVSGYDMSRLHIGGLGTLGIIGEVSFKLTPLPRTEATLIAAFGSGHTCLDAGLSIFQSHVMPLALTALDSEINDRAGATGLRGSHFLAVRLGARPQTLERQFKECGGLCTRHGATAIERLEGADADAIWRRIADFGWGRNTTPLMAAKASLVPTKIADVTSAMAQLGSGAGLQPALISHVGYGHILINWFADGANVPDEVAKEALRRARHAAHDAGGRLVIERCPPEVKSTFDVWDDVGGPMEVMRRMKEQYDPNGILNPGRFAAGI